MTEIGVLGNHMSLWQQPWMLTNQKTWRRPVNHFVHSLTGFGDVVAGMETARL